MCSPTHLDYDEAPLPLAAIGSALNEAKINGNNYNLSD